MNYGKKATMQLLRKYDNKSSKVKNKFKLIVLKILLVVVIVAGAAGISSGIGVMKGIIDSAPDISKIDVTPTGYSTTVLAANGEETATLVGQGANRQYVTIDEIPLDLQHAFVAIEDERFYDHNGIDLHGIGRAFISGLSKGRFSEGASTITQQLIKNNVLTSWTSETSFVEKLQRKIQEQYLALELEKQVNDKDWILENYMNSVNLGANTLGVQAASKKYFNKDVSELTLSEASVIAGITQNPSGYNPGTKSSLDDLAEGDTIAVPNDTTNEARALLLLQDNGIITLKDGAGLEATVNDIAENPKNIKIQELEAAQVARVTGEGAYVVLNGNYALEAGYSVGKDALAYEKSDSEAAKTYVNVIAVKEGNENNPAIKALVDTLKSDTIKQYINDTYDGAVIPFED